MKWKIYGPEKVHGVLRRGLCLKLLDIVAFCKLFLVQYDLLWLDNEEKLNC